MRRSLPIRLRRLGYWLVVIPAGLVFFGAVSHHVYSVDFRPLAAFCLPVLVVFFAFTSLLYMRGRSLARSKAQVRTMTEAYTTRARHVDHRMPLAPHHQDAGEVGDLSSALGR